MTTWYQYTIELKILILGYALFGLGAGIMGYALNRFDWPWIVQALVGLVGMAIAVAGACILWQSCERMAEE